MARLRQRALLMQLLSVYVLFVLIVLTGDLAVNSLAERHVRQDVQSSDQALAQSIALQTGLQIQGAEEALSNLTQLVLPGESSEAITHTFQAFQIARPDVDHVYWLDSVGSIQIVWPGASVVDYRGGVGAEFAPPEVVPRALMTNAPVVDVGISAVTTSMPSVLLAQVVHTSQNTISGIVVISLSLVQLSQPLQAIVREQQRLHRTLDISIIDERGELIATSESDPRRLQSALLVNALNDLPGAQQAITQNFSSSTFTADEYGHDALFSAVPLLAPKWAVVVKRPANEAFAVITTLHFWLLLAALLFALGGLFFWLLLVNRVIRPLHILAKEHQALPSTKSESLTNASLIERQDEVGALARSLQRLEHDGLTKLSELHTLLDTSTAVVGSLDPYAVVGTIIAEVRRLVAVQAAAVLVPDDQGTLRVLVSDGHDKYYDQVLSLDPANVGSSAVLALRDGRPVQKLLDGTATSPALSYGEGFRAVLAVPIISRHAGGVVLLVHRTEPNLFTQAEIDLLLTFANYATLAWEHAVLYERSDERMRQIAKENEELYRQALKTNEFKTTLLEAVSHEIRTPLAAIKGHASTLLQDDIIWPPEDERHFLQTISHETDRLAQLVSNLLDLSRQEAKILQLRRSPITLKTLVKQVEERQTTNDIQLVFKIPDDLPLVEVDDARIEVVLRNLLANAITYGANNVQISATNRADDVVVVSVADNGPGIPEDELPHIFERYYRTYEGQRLHSGGTGLGLSICRAFIEAHGGTIWVERQQPDGGLCISFTLPIASAVTLAADDALPIEGIT